MMLYPALSNLTTMSSDYLRNSDVYIECDNDSHDITLLFISGIKQRQITMKCQKVLAYTMIRIPLDNTAPFFVGEVRFTEKPLNTILEKHHMMFAHAEEYPTILCIEVVGAIDATILCLEMDYSMHEL